MVQMICIWFRWFTASPWSLCFIKIHNGASWAYPSCPVKRPLNGNYYYYYYYFQVFVFIYYKDSACLTGSRLKRWKNVADGREKVVLFYPCMCILLASLWKCLSFWGTPKYHLNPSLASIFEVEWELDDDCSLLTHLMLILGLLIPCMVECFLEQFWLDAFLPHLNGCSVSHLLT